MKQFTLFVAILVLISGCKARSRGTSKTASALEDSVTAEMLSTCKADPNRCRAGYFAQLGLLPPVSCSSLWKTNKSEDVIGFDKFNNVYQREFSQNRMPTAKNHWQTATFKDVFFKRPASSQGIKQYDYNYFDVLMYVSDKYRNKNISGISSDDWEGLPLGILDGDGKTPLVPTYFAVKVMNKLLDPVNGSEEWLIYQPYAPWVYSSEFRDNVGKPPNQTMKEMLAVGSGLCVPIQSTPKSLLHSQVKTYQESKTARAEEQKWNAINSAGFAFIDLAPVTAQIRGVYRVAKGETSWYRESVFQAQLIATYVIPFAAEGKVSQGTFLVIRAAASAANFGEGAFQAVDSYNAFKKGDNLSGVLHGGFAALNFTAGVGFALEAYTSLNKAVSVASKSGKVAAKGGVAAEVSQLEAIERAKAAKETVSVTWNPYNEIPEAGYRDWGLIREVPVSDVGASLPKDLPQPVFNALRNEGTNILSQSTYKNKVLDDISFITKAHGDINVDVAIFPNPGNKYTFSVELVTGTDTFRGQIEGATTQQINSVRQAWSAGLAKCQNCDLVQKLMNIGQNQQLKSLPIDVLPSFIEQLKTVRSGLQLPN